jgi:Fe-S-cluster containining protein
MIPSSTCVTCGACCAGYRVSFYWSEADPSAGGRVPPELVEPVSPFLVCMAGTKHDGGRCVALSGMIGTEVSCTIYADRSSACREFGDESARCDQARARHGLPPLRSEQLLELDQDPLKLSL